MTWLNELVRNEYKSGLDIDNWRKSGKKKTIEGAISFDMFLFLLKEQVNFKVTMKGKNNV